MDNIHTPKDMFTHKVIGYSPESTKAYAANVLQYLMEQAAFRPLEFVQLNELIESPDSENAMVALSIMEAKLSTQTPIENVSNIHSTEPQVPELRP